jgi:putative tryptophan/tyrosine transport system substrate-binding protein
MRRRGLIALFGGAITMAPLAARAQKAPVRIGLLFAGGANSLLTKARIAAINEGLRGNGMAEGRDYLLETRFADGKYERFPDLAGELARAGSGMILGNTIAAVRAAQRLAPPVPIVMMAINDPVGTGLIASLARPGGRTTGMATLNEDVTPKMLEFMRTIVPEMKIVGVLFNPANPSNPAMVDNIRARVGAMGMTVHAAGVRLPEELDAALAALAAGKPDALLLLPDAANLDLADRIASFAIGHRLPFLVSWPEVVEYGGLLGYGASERKLLVRTGYYVRRILDGANPADLPVEQPTEIELRLNLKTAAALGLTLPQALLATANDVIE